RSEAAPVVRTRAMLAQRAQVLGRRVALVAVEAVLRMLRVQLHAETVAVHLGDDRRRRDRANLCIAADDGANRHRQLRPLVAVDEDDLRLLGETLYGAPHRQQRRMQDVERVDLGDARRRDADADRALPDLAVEPLALFGAEQLRIVQAADRSLLLADP